MLKDQTPELRRGKVVLLGRHFRPKCQFHSGVIKCGSRFIRKVAHLQTYFAELILTVLLAKLVVSPDAINKTGM